jgi:hypothetical protein
LFSAEKQKPYHTIPPVTFTGVQNTQSVLTTPAGCVSAGPGLAGTCILDGVKKILVALLSTGNYDM